MDRRVQRFREHARRENRGRRGVQRRYSESLQRQAVSYYEEQRSKGTSLAEVAQALGVSGWSLFRWVKGSRWRAGFRPVEVMEAAALPRDEGRVVVISPQGYRVEGLDVEGVIQLLSVAR